MGVGRGARGGQAPRLDFEMFGKKGYLSFEWEKTNFITVGPPPGQISLVAPSWKKSFRRPWLLYLFIILLSLDTSLVCSVTDGC